MKPGLFLGERNALGLTGCQLVGDTVPDMTTDRERYTNSLIAIDQRHQASFGCRRMLAFVQELHPNQGRIS